MGFLMVGRWLIFFFLDGRHKYSLSKYLIQNGFRMGGWADERKSLWTVGLRISFLLWVVLLGRDIGYKMS